MLTHALKDWHAVTNLLAQGEVCLTLRKGGIHEPSGPGVFELEHPRFLLYPAYEHQKPEGIRPEFRHLITDTTEPDRVTLTAWAAAEAIWIAPDRDRLEPLRDLLAWDTPQIDMRFDYKPDRPVYAVLLNVTRLPQPVTVDNRPEYRGCRSWVPLHPDDETPPEGTPALTHDHLAAARDRIETALRP
ncbi:DUF1802 family protein [Mucisphaera calidilacus]|uniref:DUF1802 family protein n=1 Tax=Mucisphaera calidilacus TaxID=2527982 RepID=A0A518BYW7_9BACT|nr:DUF1802 family protein [Mucisphaera calidilacus]QDU72161.1 hypothetical protein Pan265_20240 [Mucisphaera calidilacus]